MIYSFPLHVRLFFFVCKMLQIQFWPSLNKKILFWCERKAYQLCTRFWRCLKNRQKSRKKLIEGHPCLHFVKSAVKININLVYTVCKKLPRLGWKINNRSNDFRHNFFSTPAKAFFKTNIAFEKSSIFTKSNLHTALPTLKVFLEQFQKYEGEFYTPKFFKYLNRAIIYSWDRTIRHPYILTSFLPRKCGLIFQNASIPIFIRSN